MESKWSQSGVYGLNLDSIWTPHGLHMDSIWSQYGVLYGAYVEPMWSLCGVHGVYVESIWSPYGIVGECQLQLIRGKIADSL
jgi:hypothetical protein